METLYKCTLFAIDNEGENRSSTNAYFTSHAKAVDWLRQQSHTALVAGHSLHCKWDWYLHLTKYTESEGRFMYEDSQLYAHFLASPDDFIAHGEHKTFEDAPLFQTL